MEAIEVLPREYGYVVLVLVLYGLLNFWMPFQVGKARKKYKVFYPTLYALESENKDAKLFNCVQRGHQNSLEMMPLFFSLLLLGGLRHPLGSAGLGILYTVGRYFYFTGYATGEPKNRLKLGSKLGGHQNHRFAYKSYLNLSYTSIKELPSEFKNVLKLKFLDLSYTKNLRTVPTGMISCFVSLKWLDLCCSMFENWKIGCCENDVADGANLVEIECLEHLETIGLYKLNSFSSKVAQLQQITSVHDLPLCLRV